MLPRSRRLHQSDDFTTVVRSGARKGRRTVVVYIHVNADFVRSGGPRIGLIVSKAVGNSVIRHRVSRRLRHIAASVLADQSDDLSVVVRALPASANATGSELGADFSSAFRKARERARDLEAIQAEASDKRVNSTDKLSVTGRAEQW